jgi:two-component system chemotaxis response regulator CheB
LVDGNRAGTIESCAPVRAALVWHVRRRGLRVTQRHDLVLIGGSAGGLEAAGTLLAALDPTLPASVVVTLHRREGPTAAAEVLSRRSRLPVQLAEHEGALSAGRVFVAPAGLHLLTDGERTFLSDAPAENRARPSINRLFRTAAARAGHRTIGVVVSGMLDDGAAGLHAIKRCGGLAIAQDPADASFPDMPENAIAAVAVDHVLSMPALAAALPALVATPAQPVAVPREVALEADLDVGGAATPTTMGQLGPQSPVSCPTCAGPLWEIGPESARTYRCYLGHAGSARDLLCHQSGRVEDALWSALRALNEQAALSGRLAADAERGGRHQAAATHAAQQRELGEQVERVHTFLLDLRALARGRGDP